MILVWFLPVGVHTLAKAVVANCRPRCQRRSKSKAGEAEEEEMEMRGGGGKSRKEEKEEDKGDGNRAKGRSRSSLFFDLLLQGCQLGLFLATFSLVTHYIVNTEFNGERRYLQVRRERSAVHIDMCRLSFYTWETDMSQ